MQKEDLEEKTVINVLGDKILHPWTRMGYYRGGKKRKEEQLLEIKTTKAENKKNFLKNDWNINLRK